ncbi:MAG: ABC transporter permease [Comamonadaceae bacterium]|nr:ABC transporter permease [Comamonadaceae bacterium]
MSFYAFMGAMEIGLIFGLVALGVLISFRILNFPDLTVDGSFPLGGAVAAILIANGRDPFIATALAAAAGAAAGFVTGWLNVRLKIMDLLAGILMMGALYSINLRVMGRPNVPLISEPTVFSVLMPGWQPEYIEKPFILLVIVLLCKLLLDAYFSTERGLAMRATGANARMASAQGVATNRAKLVGLAISNALVALGGALFAQSQGGADISMGIGTIVIGLAAVIIGESVLPSRRILWATLAVVIGAVLYRLFIALALESGEWTGLQSQDLNLIASALVVLVLVLPLIKRGLRARK